MDHLRPSLIITHHHSYYILSVALANHRPQLTTLIYLHETPINTHFCNQDKISWLKFRTINWLNCFYPPRNQKIILWVHKNQEMFFSAEILIRAHNLVTKKCYEIIFNCKLDKAFANTINFFSCLMENISSEILGKSMLDS